MNVTVCFSGIHTRGGVERVALQCVRHLAAEGHAVRALCGEFQAVDGVQHDRVDVPSRPSFLRPRRFFDASSRAWNAIANHGILNVHGCVGPLGGVHWVQSVHAAWLEACAKLYSPFSSRRFLQRLNPLHRELLRLERLHFGRGGHRKLIVTTVQVREDLVRIYGVSRDEVAIIPNGFDPAEFNPERRARRREEARHSIRINDPRTRVLLMVANELERKGYVQTLRAVRSLSKDVDVRLVLVGRASRATALRLASREGVIDRVIVVGPTSDVGLYHAAADLFVLPTQYEALSLAILESLGSGLAVVTSRVPGAHDAVREGVNGMLVSDPLDDVVLTRVLRDALRPESLEALARSTVGSVDEYAWPSVLRRYVSVLSECK